MTLRVEGYFFGGWHRIITGKESEMKDIMDEIVRFSCVLRSMNNLSFCKADVEGHIVFVRIDEIKALREVEE